MLASGISKEDLEAKSVLALKLKPKHHNCVPCTENHYKETKGGATFMTINQGDDENGHWHGNQYDEFGHGHCHGDENDEHGENDHGHGHDHYHEHRKIVAVKFYKPK